MLLRNLKCTSRPWDKWSNLIIGFWTNEGWPNMGSLQADWSHTGIKTHFFSESNEIEMKLMLFLWWEGYLDHFIDISNCRKISDNDLFSNYLEANPVSSIHLLCLVTQLKRPDGNWNAAFSILNRGPEYVSVVKTSLIISVHNAYRVDHFNIQPLGMMRARHMKILDFIYLCYSSLL